MTARLPTSRRDIPYEQIALVLQGGGALGAYQAGVIEGLQRGGVEPDWVAGISIGALNAAVFAGNAPADRAAALQAFWDDLCRPPLALGMQSMLQTWWETYVQHTRGVSRLAFSALDATSAMFAGQPAFFRPRAVPPLVDPQGLPQHASFYDTSPLKETLLRHADFDRINHRSAPRVSVGAVQVSTANLVYFDNRKTALRPEHFMASGALPPGFPAVEIDGEFYWDGGLVSNTPLSMVLQSRPRRDTLVFQVDLWSAQGCIPRDLMSVQARQKDIQYSSRTRAITDLMSQTQQQRDLLKQLLELLPADLQDHPAARQARQMAADRVVKVVHLILRDPTLDGHFKDYDFGAPTLRQHWAHGLQDLTRSLEDPRLLARPPEGETFVTHDVHRSHTQQRGPRIAPVGRLAGDGRDLSEDDAASADTSPRHTLKTP